MRHMHGAEAHICSAVQPKHAPPCGIAIHMKGSARQRKTNMEKDNMNDELLGGLPESDADGAEYEEVYIEEELENGESADDELTDDEDYTEISYETLVMTDRDSHRAIIPDELSKPEDLLRAVVRVLDSKKARGLKVLRVADKTIIADYFVMCTGTSNTQLRALSGELEERLAEVCERVCPILAQAKALHDELEALYNPHVDFAGVHALAQTHIARLKK